jgi:AcrR family transcriptional regulator
LHDVDLAAPLRKSTIGRIHIGMSKGESTRGRILDEAIAVASVDGLGGLTLGRLAESVGMSKSGLFAHFRSKEELQLQVLEETIARFRDRVVAPALAAPRGEPRVRALFDGWLAWAEEPTVPGGCLFMQAIAELDDQPGPVRDRLAESQRDWRDFLVDAARRAVDAGHFRADLDPELFVFQVQGIAFARHQASRLLHDPAADTRARQAFEALVAAARR